MTAWRSIPGFPGYEVTASGRVRNAGTGYVLTPRKGYVALCQDGQASRCAVRQLAASAWPKEPEAPAAPEVSEMELLSRADRDELLDLAGEYDCLNEEATDLYADCAGLQETAVLLEEQVARLQSQVADLEAELAVYRVSASI